MGQRFGLSRSTLLYYDSIGLLKPARRSSSNYRLYGGDEVRRMEQIELYRQAGLPLAEIARVLDHQDPGSLEQLLEQRLNALNDEIGTLRRQQRLLLELSRNGALSSRAKVVDKDTWVGMLRAAGMNEEEMLRWHREFERSAPNGHQDFLESLGLSAGEVARIRGVSKVTDEKSPPG